MLILSWEIDWMKKDWLDIVVARTATAIITKCVHRQRLIRRLTIIRNIGHTPLGVSSSGVTMCSRLVTGIDVSPVKVSSEGDNLFCSREDRKSSLSMSSENASAIRVLLVVLVSTFFGACNGDSTDPADASPLIFDGTIPPLRVDSFLLFFAIPLDVCAGGILLRDGVDVDADVDVVVAFLSSS